MPVNFTQNQRFRQVKEERLDEFNFIGGLIKDTHETKLKPNQSPNLANVLFNTTGSIKTRKGYTRYNGDAVGSSADQTNFGASTGTLAITTASTYVAQTFQASGAISCTQIDLSLAMASSSLEQDVRVEIWSTSAGAPSTQITTNNFLARSQVLRVSGTAETTYTFRFLHPITIVAATTYAIVIRPFMRSSSTTVNQVNVHHTGTAYATYQVYNSSNGGIAWTGDANKDLKFRVYKNGNTGCTGLIRFYGSAGISQTLAKFGTSLYRGNDGTGAMTAITLGSGSSLSTGYIDWTVTAEGTLLVVDGSNEVQKYRGSTNANYTTGTLSVTVGSPTITGSGTTWNTITNAEAGEYIKLPDGKWYKILSIASNTSLTIEVNYPGATLAGQTYTISPWGEVQGRFSTGTTTAPTPEFIENHKDRIWTMNGNNLKSSVLDLSVSGEHFNDFDTANNAVEINIPSGKGDTGTGLYSLGNALYVFQKRAIWAIYGSSPGDFELRNITNEIGMVHKKTLVEYDNFVMFLSNEDVYMFDGSNLRNVSDGKVKELIRTWANKSSAVATLWDNKYVIAYTPTSDTHNSKVLYYDITRDAWGEFTNMWASTFSTWGGGADSNQLYFGSSNQGALYKFNTGTNDDHYEIPMLYDTASLGYGANTNDKIIKKFYLQLITQGDYDLAVTQLSDISSSEIVSTVNMSAGTTSLWDVAQWDVDVWSDEGTLITERIAEFQGSAKYFKFRFENNGLDEPVEILGLTNTVRARRLT